MNELEYATHRVNRVMQSVSAVLMVGSDDAGWKTSSPDRIATIINNLFAAVREADPTLPAVVDIIFDSRRSHLPESLGVISEPTAHQVAVRFGGHVCRMIQSCLPSLRNARGATLASNVRADEVAEHRSTVQSTLLSLYEDFSKNGGHIRAMVKSESLWAKQKPPDKATKRQPNGKKSAESKKNPRPAFPTDKDQVAFLNHLKSWFKDTAPSDTDQKAVAIANAEFFKSNPLIPKSKHNTMKKITRNNRYYWDPRESAES